MDNSYTGHPIHTSYQTILMKHFGEMSNSTAVATVQPEEGSTKTFFTPLSL